MWESLIPLLINTAAGAVAANAGGGNPWQGALGGALGGGLGTLAAGGLQPNRQGSIDQGNAAGQGAPWLNTILSGLGGAGALLGPAIIAGMGGKGPLGQSLGPKPRKGPSPAQELIVRLMAGKGKPVRVPTELLLNGDFLGIQPPKPSSLSTGATIGGLGAMGAALGMRGAMQQQPSASETVGAIGPSAGIREKIAAMDPVQVMDIVTSMPDEQWEALDPEIRSALAEATDWEAYEPMPGQEVY